MYYKIIKPLIIVSIYTFVSFFYTPSFAKPTQQIVHKADQQKNTKTSLNLDKVQQAINVQQKTISLKNKKRSVLEKRLKNDELAIAKAAKAVNQTNKQIQQTHQKIGQLRQQKFQLNKQKKHQQSLLAQQLRASYSTGNHDYLKLILNQEKPATVQRTLSYYQYFNQARIKEITNVEQTVKALNKVSEQQTVELAKLTQLKQQQVTQQHQLKASNKNRKNTIKKLSKQLLTDKQKLRKLKNEEQNLAIELAKLQKIAQAEVTLAGLSRLKHKLSWPTKGRLFKRFGNHKQGSLRWKGVLITAPVGRDIKSIHNGKVLFSDWLNGYGLVIVIDHGNGYMSLYGHNQALLKNVGERVETGEPIALVGQSGGQNRSGLYFEIRHDGRAVNPKTWCK
ncbi:MAG: peptidase M23 [Gammaproteobacteria bacterium]|nr:MAG: peptidase M23 [Gammaproteobacteria bacterium]